MSNLVNIPSARKRGGYSIDKPGLLNLAYVPALALFCIFIAYPFFQGILVSFTNWNGYSTTYQIVGLDNLRRMFTDRDIQTVVTNTFIYGFGSTFFQNLLGLACALMLFRHFPGKNVIRTVVYLPVIISPLIMGNIWYLLLQYRYGAIYDVMKLFINNPPNLMGNPQGNVWIIMGINAYQFMGKTMLIYMAGLSNIDDDYFDAAKIDGANQWQQFKKVTFPLLAPSITISVIYNLIGGLKLFDVINALTKGGPGFRTASLSTMMYDLYFTRQDAGYAASVGNFMFVIIAVFSITAWAFMRKREDALH